MMFTISAINDINKIINQFMIEYPVQQFEQIAIDDSWTLNKVLILHV